MSKGLRVTLLTVGGIVAVAALLLIGMNIGRAATFSADAWSDGSFILRSDLDYPHRGSMMGWPSLGFQHGNSMMVSGMMAPGMMATGMMGYTQAGAPYGSGMMGQFGGAALLGIQPIKVEEAWAAVQSYLEELGVEDLEVGEVMIFDNHAYVQVLEQSTGIGAFELLVDPVTLSVSPEHGPNMMWNLKYGSIGGYGMMGMMGGLGFSSEGSLLEIDPGSFDDTDLAISPGEAVQAAQSYLDTYLPGAEADSAVDTFYGYYTIHILRDGDTVGMLSVNGTTAQVWIHSWHGEFIETSEHD